MFYNSIVKPKYVACYFASFIHCKIHPLTEYPYIVLSDCK